MFTLQDVSKSYRQNLLDVVALHPTTLEIKSGEFIAVVGPSGSGKTTLLSLLGGMLAPSTGEVRLDSLSLYDSTPLERAQLRRQKIGFVFQMFNLIPYLTAIENVKVPLMLSGLKATQQEERAAELLQRVGLESRLHHKPSELSTGQQQRVALARTMANDPAVILADEPTGNLDPQSRQHILDFLDRFRSDGRTVVMVTHDLVAGERASRMLKLADGRVIDDSRVANAYAA